MSLALCTVAVPAVARDVLPRPAPIVGDERDTEGVLGFLDRVQCESAEYQSEIAGAMTALDDLRGSSARAVDARLNRLAEGAHALHESAQHAYFAVRDFAGLILELHARSRTLERTVEGNLQTIRGAASEITELSQGLGVWVEWGWRTPPPLVPPRSAVPCAGGPGLEGMALEFGGAILREFERERWTWAVRRWRGAIEEIDSSVREWQALVDERRCAERALARALESTDVGRALALADGGAAGPGSDLSSMARAMMTAFTPERPWERQDVQSLIGAGLSPQAATAAWGRLAESGADLDQLLEQYCFELANVDGIPFWARDRAGRFALDYALESDEHTLEAFRRMGFTRSEHSVIEFASELRAVQRSLRKADRVSPPAMLVGLGRHDGVVTAAISLGDLDSSRKVGVFVSGMRSDVTQLDDAFDAFRRVHKNTPDAALVTWIGYRAPGIGGELLQGRAERGRFALSSFLEGASVARDGEPMDRLVVMAHSYGTNVAAEALKITDTRVDAFVTIGSAGLAVGTTREQLHTGEVYATHANGDNIALIGQAVHLRSMSDGGGLYEARVDPRELQGVRVFSSEESAEGQAVTMHNLVKPIDWGPFQWIADLDGHGREDEVGYLDMDSSTVFQLGRIMEGQM